MMSIPRFISIGHLTHDIIGDSPTPGGSALYSVRTAANLGMHSGIVTSCSFPLLEPELLAGIELKSLETEVTTTFENLYNHLGERRQRVHGTAGRIDPELIPESWRDAEIINLCPVASEFSPEIVKQFSESTIGLCPQGWMRSWDSQGWVFKKNWDGYQSTLPDTTVVFFSMEDVEAPEEIVKRYSAHTMVVMTRGRGGATVYTSEKEFHVPAFKSIEVDPTGAGDVFAAAFLIKYHETKDPVQAATYGNCTASFVIEKKGVYGIPDADAVAERMRSGARYESGSRG